MKLGARPDPSRKLPSREGGGWYSDAPNRPRPTDRYCAAAAAMVAPLSQRSLGPSGTGCRGGPCRAASHLMVNTFGLLSLIPSQGAPLRPRLKARARPRWLPMAGGPRMDKRRRRSCQWQRSCAPPPRPRGLPPKHEKYGQRNIPRNEQPRRIVQSTEYAPYGMLQYYTCVYDSLTYRRVAYPQSVAACATQNPVQRSPYRPDRE